MSATLLSSQSELDQLHGAGKTIAFVPTMGALHTGHLALVTKAQELAGIVVVSIFVNPLQFGPSEDFERYPRSLDKDIALLPDGVFVYAPSVEEVYPGGQEAAPLLHAGSVGELFEGAHRPGHFDGMLTVVNRLFNLVKPDIAVFGQKDAQQVFLVRSMIQQQGLDIDLVVVPTVRETDGLALSSRNVYLSPEEREAAAIIPRAINTVVTTVKSGSATDAIASAARMFAEQPLVRLDYLELVDPATFLPVPENYVGAATLIVAAHLGNTRLIDTENLEIVHA